MPKTETATRLMDAAQSMIQRRGFNAFSYKDLAEAVGIRTASIHYHFPAKSDLGVALMQRYLEGLEASLAEIEGSARSNKAKLKGLIKLYSTTEAGGAICLCGSLASDQATLPEPLQELVADYLGRTEQWIANRIRDGIEAGEFRPAGKPAELAATLTSSLQGGLILSRARAGGAPVLAAVQRTFFNALES